MFARVIVVLLKQSKAQMSRLFANFVSFKQTEPETFSFFFFWSRQTNHKNTRVIVSIREITRVIELGKMKLCISVAQKYFQT